MPLISKINLIEHNVLTLPCFHGERMTVRRPPVRVCSCTLPTEEVETKHQTYYIPPWRPSSDDAFPSQNCHFVIVNGVTTLPSQKFFLLRLSFVKQNFKSRHMMEMNLYLYSTLSALPYTIHFTEAVITTIFL